MATDTASRLREVPSLLEQSVAALAIARILAGLERVPNYNFASSEWQGDCVELDTATA